MKIETSYSTRLPVLVLILIGLFATFMGWHSAAKNAETRAHERFEFRMQEIKSAISERMLAYEHVLRGGAGLFAASDNDVDRAAWYTYVDSLNINDNYPGIQGMGFSKRILPHEMEAHVAEMQGRYTSEYHIRPAGERAEYTSIIYLEPFDERNKRAYGFDMFSEPTRRAAMELARDTGTTSISGKVKLLQEGKKDVQAGFLMYLPVYLGVVQPTNTEERRAALLGYVYSPFRMNDLMQGILGEAASDLALQIYDGNELKETALMYDSHPDKNRNAPLFAANQKLLINGHMWTLEVESLPLFEHNIDWHVANVVAASGLALTLLMALLLWSMLSTRARAHWMARTMTATLRENEERLRSVVDTAVDAIIVISENGLIESSNAAASKIFGYSAEEMLGNNINMLMPEPYHAQHDGYLERYLQTGKANVIGIGREVQGLRKDGTVFPMELSVGDMHVGSVRKFTGMVRDITERKKADHVLRETLRMQHAILDSASYAIISTTVDGTIAAFNPAAERLLGYRAADLLGKETPGIFHLPAEVAERAAALSKELGREIAPGFEVFVVKARMGEGVADENEWTYVRSDGRHVPVLLSVTALRNEQAEVTGFLGIASDISVRKAFETALHESEERYRMIAEYSSDMISKFSADGKFNYVSPASANLLGYEPNEMLGKSLFDWVHPDDRAMAQEKLASVLATYMLDTLTCRVRSREGQHIWMETSLRGLHDETDGAVRGQVVGISRDVTERVQTSASLNRFKHILDNTLDMLFMFEPDTLRFVYLNKGAVEMMGYDSEELLEMKPYQIKPLIPEPKFRELIAPLLSGEKQSLNFETIHRRKDGSEFPVEIFLQLVKEEDGKGLFVALVRDITERQKVDRLKSEFVSTVSHELRTPLTSIRGSLGLVLGGVTGELTAQSKSLLDIAYKNTERLVRLINDILDIEKIESGKMAFDLKPQSVLSIVEQALESNRAYADQFKVAFELKVDMPDVKVNVDHDRLTQVLANLLSNAAKFSPAGGKVEITVQPRNGKVRISVIDHGEGIPEAFRSKIFQKFSQADGSDTKQKGGTGLGLSISKAMVEKMDGVMGFESELGSGSTFYFDLPEWCENGQCLLAEAPEEDRKTGRHRVLVCEDDQDVARLLGMMLEDGGYEVDIAYDAGQAKHLLARHPYAAMTLDLILPGQDGIALIRELRAQEATSDLPVIVVSARADEGRAEINGGFSIVDWLGKPIDHQRLMAQMEKIANLADTKKPRVLHIEDDEDVRQVVAALVKNIVELDTASTLAEAREMLRQTRYNLIILDLTLPDGSGWDLLPWLRDSVAHTPVMIFSADSEAGMADKQVAATLIKAETSNQVLLDTIARLVKNGIYQQK